MNRGDVWWVRMPPRGGHLQAGNRPAVIIQDDRYISSLSTVLTVPFTSSAAATRFDGTLLVQPDGRNGLTTPSVALVFQATALDQRDVLRRLGVLDAAILDQILALLDRLTGR
jgi:mRNA-degrading endonuclease toxin of MazEF toxin-antitoxin module